MNNFKYGAILASICAAGSLFSVTTQQFFDRCEIGSFTPAIGLVVTNYKFESDGSLTLDLFDTKYHTSGKASNFGRSNASAIQRISKNGIKALCYRTEVHGHNEPGDPRDYRHINTTRILDNNGNE